MILTDYFIGFIEDNAGLFSIPHLISGLKGCTDFVGYPTGLCQNLLVNNQPFIFIPAFLLAQILNPVLAYNLIVLGGTALSFFFALRFFRKLFGRFIAVLLATIFLFSPFLAYQSRAHFDLLQFWPVIWFLDTLFFSKSQHKAVFLGLLLTLITGISNYLGYFTLLFSGLYVIASFLTKPSFRATSWVSIIRPATTVIVVFALSSSFFIAPYIKSNYFSPQVRTEASADAKAINRPFEDFVTFSSRPWYYLLPSMDNPFFGELSQKFLDRISSGENYLTQNYFKAEHSASYLGWVNIALALVGIASLRGRRPKQSEIALASPRDSGVSINYPALLLTIVGLITLTMPPATTINGVTLYTPSYLLFKIFPMFRVLARAGVLILFLTSIFTGYGYCALVNLLIDKKIKPWVMRSFLAILALLSIAEFFIPLKITHVGTPPKVYAYIKATDPLKSPIVVYPYNKTNEALFWMNVYQQPLINPRGYSNKDTGFVSEDFTNLLTTSQGLEKARIMGAKYLVYFYEDDQSKNISFFNQIDYLTRVAEFKEESPGERQIFIPPFSKITIIRVVEAGSAKSNSAILYEFR